MELIDTHTHLYLKEFDSDIDQVVNKSKELGINKFIFPSIHSKYNKRMIYTYNKDRSIFDIMAGLHPAYVSNNNDKEIDLVVENLKKYDCVAVGEIGIDLYWEEKFLEQQKIVFKKQIELALDYNLPIVIHCFTGSKNFAKKIVDLGFYISVSGIITFKNSTELMDTVSYIPTDRLLVETDSPYLAPVPYRGKSNEPSYIKHTVEKLSHLKKIPINDIMKTTSNNFFKIFNLN